MQPNEGYFCCCCCDFIRFDWNIRHTKRAVIIFWCLLLLYWFLHVSLSLSRFCVRLLWSIFVSIDTYWCIYGVFTPKKFIDIICSSIICYPAIMSVMFSIGFNRHMIHSVIYWYERRTFYVYTTAIGCHCTMSLQKHILCPYFSWG